jgi:WD40 repeat protein
MMPGAQPYNELAAALLKVAIDPPKNLMAALRADTGHLGQAIRDLIPQDGQFVLFIDQFEELFTQVEDEAERLAFLESLLKALEDPQGQLWVILTLRADFYDRPLYYKAFGEALRQRTEVILPLSTEELHDSIEKPAERAGLELEHGLASMIVGEVMEQPGGLPLLQYALTELFNRRENRNLSLKAFREMGGVSGALARRAETLYEAAPPAQQDLIRQIFIRLVTLGEGTEDTRRRIALKELYSLGLEKAKVDEVLGTFGQYRLLTFDHDPLSREPNLELAHEALIRQWQTLRAWISDLRDDLRQQARLASIAQEWERAGRDPSYLANGAQLDQFQAWAGQTSILLNTREQAFLQASTQKEADREAREQAQAAREKALEDRSRRFLRALVAVLALALLGALGLILTTLQARDEAEAAQAKAESQQSIAQSLALVAEARNALSAGEPNTALGLSLAAANLTSPPLADAELLLSQSAYGPGLRYQMGGHTASLVAVTFSPDGRYALTASVDQTAILWDLSTGQEVSRLSGGHNGPVTAVAFSPDGRLAATGSFDKTTLIWDLSSGGVRHILTHEDQVNAIAFSPDGRYLATAAGNARQVERDTAARLWEVESGRLIRSYIHIGAVQALAFSPDGRYLVTTSGGVDTNNQSVDRRGRLWEVETGRLITRYEGFTGGIRDVDFNSDGSRLVFGTWDVANSGTIRVFDTQSAEEIERIFAHPNVVTRVRFSPDDSLIFSASWDSSVRIWDAVRGLEVRKFTAHTDRVLAMDISPDGQFLLTGTGNLGDNFEVERGRDLQARLWDLQPRAEVTRYMGHEDWVWSVAYHPTEDLMASSSGHFLEPEGDHSIRFWRASTGEELRVLQGHNFTVDHVTFSRDGQWLASSDWGGVVWLWEAPSGVATRQLSGLIDRAYSVDFHPDGRRLIGGSAGKMIIEWDISTGLEIRRWENLEGGIYSVKYSPDGRSFLSSDTDGRIILWDTESGAEIRRFVGHANRVDRAIFSPDGSLILSVSSRDGTARLWETATGQELRQLRGHIGGVTDGVFDSTGKWIVTGGPDKTVRVWLTETGQEIRRFEGHTDWVVSVDISPDGQFILSGSDDLSVRQWQFARDVAALEAWARVNRHIPPLACSDIQPLGLELECE